MQSYPIARSRPALEWKKPLFFGLWAAFGTLLCALLGEVWLAMTMAPPPPPPPPPPAPPPQAVVLVLDTSGSMTGQPFSEMKRAALEYVGRQDLKRTRIGIVSFDTQSRIWSGLTRDSAALQSAINSLTVDGVTRMDLGLSSALSISPAPPPSELLGEKNSDSAERRSVLLFTDGYPEDADSSVDAAGLTRTVASKIRSSGCRLVAVGSDGSDRNFLAELTGDPNLVFAASDGQFGEAFKLAENAINAPTGRALIQSQKIDNFDAGREMLRISVWTGLLGLGLSTALLLSQGAYARRRVGVRELPGIIAGLIAGLAAGALGQWMFNQAGDASLAITMGRLLAWATGGALVGIGISPFIPNLAPTRAALGGALGGWIGAMGFIAVSHASNDMAGRLLGASILGFAIGLMVVLAEVAFRKAWLHVSYGPRDAFELNLGSQAVVVGSDRAQCRIMARETPPVAARYLFEKGQAILVDPAGARHLLPSGDRRRFGNVEITLCTEAMGSPVESAFIAPPSGSSLVSDPNVLKPLPVPPAPVIAAAVPVIPSPPAPIAAEGWILQGLENITLPSTSPLFIGRDASNTVSIPDAGVSARHAKVTVGKALLTVTDLGSTNGTFVNGVRLTANVSTPLRDGDRLVLGKLHFVVVRSEG